jgi:hypothetical protein
LRIPNVGIVRSVGIAGFEDEDRNTTVVALGAVTVTPAKKDETGLRRFTSLRSEKTTSAEVNREPSANLTPLRILKVNVLEFGAAVYEVASQGRGFEPRPSEVRSVSYAAF